MRRAYTLALALLVAALTIAAACSDAILSTYCTDIPVATGCAGVDDTNCACPSCSAIYSCQGGTTWTFVQKCPDYVPPHDAGHEATSDAGFDDGESPVDAPVRDAGFVLPEGAGGGPGCPDLESPDCSLKDALQCGTFCCGCEDLYVCSDGGWNLWGECNDAGAVVSDSQ